MALNSCRDIRTRGWGRAAAVVAILLSLLLGIPATAGSAAMPRVLIPNDGTYGFFNVRTEATTVDEFAEVTLEMEWAVPPGTVGGDTIRIVLPPSLDELSFQAFDVRETGGLGLGVASLDRSDPANPALVFTFNSNVELGTAGARGEASFALSIDRSQLVFVDGRDDIDVYGETVTVTENTSINATLPMKTGGWRPNQLTATALNPDGSLIQPDRHMEYAVYLPVDTATSSEDDWAAVSFTEPPLNGFEPYCTNFGPNQLNGFRVEVLQPGGFTVVPIPSPTMLQLTSVVCNADGSMTVSAVKPLADTGNYYRIFYNASLITDAFGRPIYTDAGGNTVVGFPVEYRNNAVVTAGSQTINVATEVAAQSGTAIGFLSNLPDIDIEKFSAPAWEGVQYDAGVPRLTPGPDPQPQNQPGEDFDIAPGKELVPNADQVVRFRISNIGTEPLTEIVVTDATNVGAAIGTIDCDFSPFGGPATGAAGGAAVLPPQGGIDCVGTLVALGPEATHADTATVTAVGVGSRIPVTDADAWNAYTPAAPTPVPPTGPAPTVPPPPAPSVVPDELPATGGGSPSTLLLAALILAAGVVVLVATRRRSA